MFKECEEPECQAVMAERRLAVEAAGAPTEEQKAVWRAQVPGRAVQKIPPAGGTTGPRRRFWRGRRT